ncbi:MAG: hypothetical protein ACRCU5_04780 [Rhizobiaceae bacterium]
MKLVKIAAASLLFSAMLAAPALAETGDNVVHYISPSIIMIGTPDPCDNGGCEEEVAEVEPTADRNAALVDAYGMPTNMPVIMRPTTDVSAVPAAQTASAPATSEPAAPSAPVETPAAAAPAEPAPATTTEMTPAPVEQAPAASAPEGEG